jgi:putative ABC transport system permease protein
MIKNYLTIAFRAIWRSKFHTLINVGGLSMGIACCLLIALYLKDELTFDRFHSKADNIYRASVREDYGENQVFFNTVTPYPLGGVLKQNFEEIAYSVRIQPMRTQVVVNNQKYNERILVADPHFFDVFDFPVIKGTTPSLEEMKDIILSRETAERYFGDADPINKTLTVRIGDIDEEFTVKAVTENTPGNSSIQFDLMISGLNFTKFVSERALTSGWFNVNPETYVLVKGGTDLTALQKKFPSVFKSILGDDYEKSKYTVGLQPLTDIHLNTDYPTGIADVSDPKYSYILGGVALLVLFLACINFITLAIGRSLKRAKEVGIRKVVGAVRKQLIVQFIGEAVVITVISLVVGVAIAGTGLPVFNDLSGKQLTLRIENFTIITAFVFIFIIGLFAGSYPAFVLSAFKPISILKGTLQSNNKNLVRKVLVGVQLVLSVFLVSSTIVMQNQLTYLQEKNLGFDRENIMVMQLNPVGRGLRDRVQNGFEQGKVFGQQFSALPQVTATSTACHDFGDGNWTQIGYTDDKGTYRELYMNVVDERFIPTMNMQMASGHDFSSGNPSYERRGVVVNEAFVKEYAMTNPIGQRLPGKNFGDHEIIGVVKDFNYSSLYTEIKPLLMVMNVEMILSGTENIMFNNSPSPKIFLKMHAGQTAAGIQAVEKLWKKISNGDDFEFSFVDQRLTEQYRGDQNLGRILQIATLLSILIGSLGLYALASLAMQNRVKEICIRKIMGATPQHLLTLLTKDFMTMILICVVLSVPITFYFMNSWLESFSYRVDIDVKVFLLAGSVAMLIGIFTISYHAIKTAGSQPAQTLKGE